jgi:hypothetical protein
VLDVRHWVSGTAERLTAAWSIWPILDLAVFPMRTVGAPCRASITLGVRSVQDTHRKSDRVRLERRVTIPLAIAIPVA